MPLTEFKVDQFGGLNLRDDPEEVGPNAAVDLLNIELIDHGRLRTRGGYNLRATTTAEAGQLGYHKRSDAPGRILVGLGTSPYSVAAYSLGGTFLTSHTFATGFSVTSYTQMRQGSTDITYIANGGDTLRTFDGVNFAAPTATVDGVAGRAMPIARWAAMVPWDFRLVVGFTTTGTGGPNGTASSPSTLYFSAPGNGANWQTQDNLQLTPGDGEAISAIVPWNPYLFVFKRTKFFVFYGTGVATGTGGPIFNYRTVDTGIGLDYVNHEIDARGAVAGRDGVYFVGHNGIYKTTGGEPVQISYPVGPLFDPLMFGGQSSYAESGDIALHYHNDRLYCMCLEAIDPFQAEVTLACDLQTGQWTVWDLRARSMITTGAEAASPIELLYTVNGFSQIRAYGAQDTDNGTPIDWHYTSGLYDLGSRTQAKRTRRSELWGTGNPTLAVLNDKAATDPNALPVTPNGSIPEQHFHNKAYRGRWFQHKLSGGAQTAASVDFDVAGDLSLFTFDLGAGTLTVSGGQLAPTDTTEKALYYTVLSETDVRVTMKLTTGASVAAGGIGVTAKRLDGSNFLMGHFGLSGAASAAVVFKKDGGVFSALATSSVFTPTTATNYWLRFRIVGDLATAEIWAVEPTPTTSPLRTISHGMIGADAAKFGTGVSGQCGIRTSSVPTDYRYDDFAIAPISDAPITVNSLSHYVADARGRR